MPEVAHIQEVHHLTEAQSREIIRETLREIWRRPSLHYMRGMAEWELYAWLLGMLNRVGSFDPSLGFLRFSRPFLWRELVETVDILIRKTVLVSGAASETQADLRHFANRYLIRMGEAYAPIAPRGSVASNDATSPSSANQP